MTGARGSELFTCIEAYSLAHKFKHTLSIPGVALEASSMVAAQLVKPSKLSSALATEIGLTVSVNGLSVGRNCICTLRGVPSIIE